MIGYGATGVTHDFYCYNAAGSVWNGAAFATWSAASFASYRVTATEKSGSGQFTGTVPSSLTTRYELRVRGSTLADSYVVWNGDFSAEDAAKLRKFFTNKRTPITGAATGYTRFRVFEDDGTTTAFDLDWKNSDGTIEPV